MLCITVAQDGSGDFASISEAVLAVPYDCPAQIRIGAGIYREKLVCEKKDIALQGAGADCTRLVWGDGVLVSDGLLVDGTAWVAKQLELSAAAGEAPAQVAKTLVETARARALRTGRPDDITAAVLRLENGG